MNQEFIKLVNQAINTDLDKGSKSRIIQIVKEDLSKQKQDHYDLLKSTILQNPDSPELIVLDALIQINCFMAISEAYELLSESIIKHDQHAPTWGLYGELLSFLIGREQQSEDAFNRAIELDNTNSDYYRNLGSLLIKNPSRLHEAKTAFESSINFSNEDIDLYLYIVQIYTRFKVFPEKSVEYLEFVTDKKPYHEAALENLAHLYTALNTDTLKIESIWKRLIEINPDSDNYKCWLAEHYYSNNLKLTEAKETLTKILERDPENILSLNMLGTILTHEENYIEAKPLLEKSYSIDKNDPITRERLGNLYLYIGTYEEAEKIFKKLIDQYPNDLSSRIGYAESFRKRNQLSRAENIIRSTIEGVENNSIRYIGFERVYFKLWQLLAAILFHDSERSEEFYKAINIVLEYSSEDQYAWELLTEYTFIHQEEGEFKIENSIVVNYAQKLLDVSNEKELKNSSHFLIEISQNSLAPFFSLTLRKRLQSESRGFYQIKSLKDAIELTRIGEINSDKLFEAIVYHFGGDSKTAFNILDVEETNEDESNFQYQFYFYLFGKSYFNKSCAEVLRSVMPIITNYDWRNHECSIRQRYYATLLLLEAHEIGLVNNLSFLQHILVEHSNDSHAFYSVLYYSLKTDDQLALEKLEMVLIEQFNNGFFERSLSSRLITSPKEIENISLMEQVEGFLHLMELSPMIQQLSDRYSEASSSINSSFQNTSNLLSKLNRQILISEPLDLWKVDEKLFKDILADNEIQQTNWLDEIESQLQSHPKLYVLLKYDQEDINPQMIATWMEALISNKGLFENFLGIIDYYRIKKVLSYEDRNLLRIYAHICLDRSRVLTFDEKWVKLIIASVSGFCLGFVPDVMLHSTGFIDDSWTATISERIYSFLRKKYENNELSSIVYTSLKKSLDF